MSSASTQFATSRGMGIYEVNHQNSIWGSSFKGDSSPNTGASAVVEADAKLDSRVRYQRYLYMLITLLCRTCKVH